MFYFFESLGEQDQQYCQTEVLKCVCVCVKSFEEIS